VAEHTWGLDQKVVLPAEPPWDAEALDELRTTEVGRRFEASWAEQRAYVAHRRAHALVAVRVDRSRQATTIDPTSQLGPVRSCPMPGGDPLDPYEPVEPGSPLPPREFAGPSGVDSWRTRDRHRPGLRRLDGWRAGGGRARRCRPPVGLITHQTFDEADYERFYAQLQPTPDDEWWARRDNTKPGIDAAGARSGRRGADAVAAWTSTPGDAGEQEVVVRLTFDDPTGHGRRPGPWVVWQRWSVTRGGTSTQLALEVWWPDKAATRLPEATWCSFVPDVAEPDRWTARQARPGGVAARRGAPRGRSLHAVGEAMAYAGPDGPLRIRTPDAPLVAPGQPNLLDADPPLPDLAGGFHVLLHDNCWGTNFPMWSEGPARFSVHDGALTPPHKPVDLSARAPSPGTAGAEGSWGCRGPRRAALLADHALVHEHHLVGDPAGEAHLVGHHQHRHALRGELAHDVEDVAHELRVEGAGGLVEQHHLRVHRQRPGDGHALLLAARELRGVGVGLLGQSPPGRASREPPRRPRPWSGGAPGAGRA
jgi:hypothetical protein